MDRGRCSSLVVGPALILTDWPTRTTPGVVCVAIGAALIGAGLGAPQRRWGGAGVALALYALVGVAWSIGWPLARGVDARPIARWLRYDPLGPLTWPIGATVLVADTVVPPVPLPGTLVACDPAAAPARPPPPGTEVGDGWFCAEVIRLRLVTPDTVVAGQPLEVTVSLTNLGREDLATTVVVEIREAWFGHDDRVLVRATQPLPPIPPDREVRQTLRVPAPAPDAAGEH